MKIYNYDENGLYVGNSDADGSPLEEGVFLIPARATTIEPLKQKDGFGIYWNADKWEYREIPKPKPEQPNEYSVWDEESWAWAEDAVLKEKYKQAEVNAEARAYLASTDWYIVRQAETGVAIPVDVVQARAEARARIVEV